MDGLKRKSLERKEEPAEADSAFVVEDNFLPIDGSSIENMQPDIASFDEPILQKTSNIISSIGLKRSTQISPVIKKEKSFSGLSKLSIFRKKILIKIVISLVIFLLLLLLLIQAFRAKREITALSADTKNHLTVAMEAIDEGDIPKAISEADVAGANIKRIKLLTQSWGQDTKYLQIISSNSKLVANEELLEATYLIANTLTNVNQQITDIGGKSTSDSVEGRGSDFIFNIAESQSSIVDLIDTSKKNLLLSRAKLVSAETRLDQGTKAQVDNAISAIDKTLNSLQFVNTLTQNDLPWLSGADGTDKNILILLQNNGELRGGSGGSLGSFGVARFTKGTLKTIDFGKNIFKIDQTFEATGNKIEVPDELKYLRGDKTWTLKDSGWAVDGEEASKKIMSFYELETGEKVDGTIMIDASAVISLLTEVGPIEMTAYGKTIDANNFRAEIENEVHNTYFDTASNLVENEPKKILGDMMPIFMNKVLAGFNNKTMAVKLVSSLSKSLKQKDITLYFKNSDFQNRLEQLNCSGAVNPSIGDYLYVNNSNIDGAKSSLSIEQKIDFTSTINADGTLSDNLTLKRKHNGTAVLPDGTNKNFVRLLLPEKSTIEKFSAIRGNFEKFFNQGLIDNNYYLTSQNGKSFVNFWMSTVPGDQSEISLAYTPNYKLSMGDSFDYVINFQKQPGANADSVEFTLNYPDQYAPVNVNNVDQSQRSIHLSLNLDRDRVIKIKFKKLTD